MQVPWLSQERRSNGVKTYIVSLTWHPIGSALAVMDSFGSVSFCDIQGNIMQIIVPASISLSPLVSISSIPLQAYLLSRRWSFQCDACM